MTHIAIQEALDGKVVVVTGAARGLGAALARQLERQLARHVLDLLDPVAEPEPLCELPVGRAQPADESRDDVTVDLGERDATFEVGGTRLTTRLIEGEFPNYRQLIPQSYPNRLTVGHEPLLDAIIQRLGSAAEEGAPETVHEGDWSPL